MKELVHAREIEQALAALRRAHRSRGQNVAPAPSGP
jgi:hypothetical protein